VKTCTNCGEAKSLSDYWKAKKNRDGLQAWCKTCLRLLAARVFFRDHSLFCAPRNPQQLGVDEMRTLIEDAE
jgi:hypothetical protein